ncbi:MAG TPA: hypothetical protein VHL11_18120 [Phototrophicaceae bacterium]|jgi:hypothetical protein|nr:hypothetical protein [Phototrophicaceae bacterium]
MATREQIAKLRDTRVKTHLNQYAPVWITDEVFIPEDDALQFQAIFQHNLYGWVNRRYRYDGFNDVLYHKGQTLLSEDKGLEIQEQEPYMTVTVDDIPNSYGG